MPMHGKTENKENEFKDFKFKQYPELLFSNILFKLNSLLMNLIPFILSN